jgi:hypothetical protein
MPAVPTDAGCGIFRTSSFDHHVRNLWIVDGLFARAIPRFGISLGR